MKISQRINTIGESVTLKLNSMANELAESGKTIYNLTAGQLPIRPPQGFVDCVKNELDFLKSFQYSPVSGFQDLRLKLIEHIKTTRNLNLEDDGIELDCVISNGAKHTFSNVIATIIDPQDEVIVISPYWISYPEIIKFYGGVTVEVKSSIYEAFEPSLAQIKKSITPKTKAIIINSPNNPAGVHYRGEWMQEFAEMMLAYPNIWIISDEIYFEVAYYDPKPTYFYQYKPELLKRTIIIEGISKALASTGLRIGYCIANKQFCNAMSKLQGQLTSGASSLMQRALSEYDFSNSSEFLRPIKEHLRLNSDLIREKLKEYNLMKCWYQTNSAFYFMIDLTQTPVFKKYQNGNKFLNDYSDQITQALVSETGVVVVPGGDFGLPNSARISLVAPKETFAKAIDELMKFLSQQ